MENQQEIKDKNFYSQKAKMLTDKYAHLERRREFQKYLDRTGALDKLTEILMDLYENPVVNFPILDYMRSRLVVPNPDVEEIKTLRPKLEEAKLFRDHLEKENKLLKEKFKKNNYTMPEDKSARTEV